MKQGKKLFGIGHGNDAHSKNYHLTEREFDGCGAIHGVVVVVVVCSSCCCSVVG